ncbi:hypothetical protein L204_102219 [Cryptococcus depauperatus]|nr:hypothetical protein L204_04717 [Cryptococcus depauperatus CBS 7855]
MASISSPGVLTPARQIQNKKRSVLLVNPADPQEFSRQSKSPSGSPIGYESPKIDLGAFASRKKTSSPPINPRLSELQAVQDGTPNSSSVKGILRTTGTPASGHGVRFFPKNKFRVITPNSSVIAPSPVKAQQTPTSNSFFSQLLAVTMSPRRKEPEPNPGPEDSWERPGDEGEVSLVASTGSAGSTILHSDEEDDEEEQHDVSWNGVPEAHTSPLGLPVLLEGDTSKDASYGELELPSAEWNLPADMSNLLSTKFPEKVSFSMGEPSTFTLPPLKSFARDSQLLSEASVDHTPVPKKGAMEKARKEEKKAEEDFWGMPNDESTGLEHTQESSNPTICVHPSPLKDVLSGTTSETQTVREPSKGGHSVHNPAESLTSLAQPFSTSSIFADMSAEQAELTWPLTRRQSGDDSISTFQSPTRSGSPRATPINKPTTNTPKSSTGDTTEFYDCTTMTLSSKAIDSSLSDYDQIAFNGTFQPAKALFAAQTAHTQALTIELELYRSLSQKLQAEVSERDEVLAKLNMRALEAEMLHTQVTDLKQELAKAKTEAAHSEIQMAQAALATTSVSHSLSSSPTTYTRSMASISKPQAQVEVRDLEIRLAKALAEGVDMTAQLQNLKRSCDDQALELKEAKAELMEMEDREKSRMIRDHEFANGEREDIKRSTIQNSATLHQQIEALRDKEEEARISKMELEDVYHQLDDAKKQNEEMQALCAEFVIAQEQLVESRKQVGELQALKEELSVAYHRLDGYETHPPPSQIDQLNEEIDRLKAHVDELAQVKCANEEEIELLLSQIENLKANRQSEDEWKSKVDLMRRKLEGKERMGTEMENMLGEEREKREKVEAECRELRRSLVTTREELVHASSKFVSTPAVQEFESLRAEVNNMRSQSALKDLEITNLQRRKAELKEDKEMLNIALDSKQQEVELMKRKFGVRGVAGCTPLTSSQLNNISPSDHGITPKTARSRRRSPLGLETPLPGTKRNPLETPSVMQPSNRYGVALYPSTKVASRVLKRDNENVLPGADKYGSLKRAVREVALA